MEQGLFPGDSFLRKNEENQEGVPPSVDLYSWYKDNEMCPDVYFYFKFLPFLGYGSKKFTKYL